MGYELLCETKPTARKDHRCIWCGQAIPKGSKYVHESSVFDGEFQNHHWHPECLHYARTVNNESTWEFEPYSEPRGIEESSHV